MLLTPPRGLAPWIDGSIEMLPPAPPGWIITTARNRATDYLRRESSRDDRHAQARLLRARDEPPEESPVQDDRLRLIFTNQRRTSDRTPAPLARFGKVEHQQAQAGGPFPSIEVALVRISCRPSFVSDLTSQESDSRRCKWRSWHQLAARNPGVPCLDARTSVAVPLG
jgi:hypothetical protein